jgi:ATP-binding cassette subfamily B protein
MAIKNKEKEEEKIDFKHNLSLYLKLAKPYKYLFIAVIAIVLIKSIANLIETYLIKELIDKGNEFVLGDLIQNEFVNILIILAVIFCGIVILQAVIDWLRGHILNRIDIDMVSALNRKFFNHLLRLSHRFHTTHKTGGLISKLSRGGDAVERMNDFIIFNGAPLFLEFIIVGSAIFYFDKLSALVVLITFIIFVGYSLYISNYQKVARVALDNAEDKAKEIMNDMFTNVDSIKYFGKERRASSIFEKLVENTKKAYLRSLDIYKWLDAGQVIILGIGIFFLLYFPLIKFLNGGITIGTIAFIYSAYFSITEPLFSFVWGVRRFYESTADLQALFKYEKIKNEIIDLPNAKNIAVKYGKIDFKNISFGYSDSKVIKNLNLHIKPGEKIALVGHSGSGKTTIVKLLYRFYDVASGEIMIDDKDIKSVKQESLRGELSIVPQEAVLFDDTIYNNILFSKPNASQAEVWKAIKLAQLDKFVKGLPQKEKTIVGERGVKLSGGEKQRVSIARAILADKKILVLDEATSSLDSQTEHEIQKELWELMKGRTTLIIAHRLSTIMHADRIVVMDKGKIVQVGKHNELIRQQGVYRKLWRLQKGGYIGE